MKTIYKYNLEITDRQLIEMPINSEILSAKNQGDNLFIWVLVDNETDLKESCEIEIFGTGNPIYENEHTCRQFIETCIMPNGLVWHLFKRIN